METVFDLQKKLGQGGQGAVYLAAERSTQQKRVVTGYCRSTDKYPLVN